MNVKRRSEWNLVPFEQSPRARDIHSSISLGKLDLNEPVQSACHDAIIGFHCCRLIWKDRCEQQKRNESIVLQVLAFIFLRIISKIKYTIHMTGNSEI